MLINFIFNIVVIWVLTYNFICEVPSQFLEQVLHILSYLFVLGAFFAYMRLKTLKIFFKEYHASAEARSIICRFIEEDYTYFYQIINVSIIVLIIILLLINSHFINLLLFVLRILINMETKRKIKLFINSLNNKKQNSDEILGRTV